MLLYCSIEMFLGHNWSKIHSSNYNSFFCCLKMKDLQFPHHFECIFGPINVTFPHRVENMFKNCDQSNFIFTKSYLLISLYMYSLYFYECKF